MEYLEEVLTPASCYVLIKLDTKRIQRLCLEVDVHSVAASIVDRCGKLKLKRQVFLLDQGVLNIKKKNRFIFMVFY
jgi:hypothetical protein